RAWIELLLGTLLGGAVGPMVKSLEMPVHAAVDLRCWIGAAALLLLAAFRGRSIWPNGRQLALSGLAGVLLGLHWWAFFYSLDVSSVAVGMLSMFTFPVWVSLVEPLVFGERLKGRTVFTAVAVLGGVALIVPSWELSNATFVGAMVGLASAWLYVGRSLLSRRLVNEIGGVSTMIWQLLAGGLILLPTLGDLQTWPTAGDWVIVVVLGVVISAIVHTLFVRLMVHVSAAVMGVLISAQPVVAMVAAWLWLGEVPTLRMLIGGAILLSAVGYEAAGQRGRRSGADVS
ncbi:MAG: EamA family transporter, partial [Phycisphaeraceae bacterium]|nr:EamA family transporter [Phycisphaeraceae bacterium]